MSESLYYAQQIASFLSAHPREEGWKVYQYSDEGPGKLYLHYLLDCLRERYPDTLKRRTAMRVVTKDEVLATPGKSHTVETGTQWDLTHELDGDGWVGSVDIEWKQQPIHFFTFLIQAGSGYEMTCLVAAKSNAVLRDFHCALKSYGEHRNKPDKREILVVNGKNIPIVKATWDDVVLPPGFAEDIRRNVQAFFQSRSRYQALRIPYRRGLLFAGPPGCGKTLTLKALAYTSGAQFITVRAQSYMDNDDFDKAFELAEKHSPAVIVFEDLDKVANCEGFSLSHFLNLLDGIDLIDGVLVIATANEPGKLDPALLHRPSRFDRIWRFSLPKYEQRLALLRKRGEAFFSDGALDEAARKSDGFSMAYVQEIVVNALLECAHEGIVPHDAALLKSVEMLRGQRRAASKDDEMLEDRQSLGFCGKKI
jgi:hypothetical protein